jgi:hypothetical protein
VDEQEEREDLQGQGGEVEIVCMNKAEARALVEAMFRVRGWEITAEKVPDWLSLKLSGAFPEAGIRIGD